jgi:hypothetical protein
VVAILSSGRIKVYYRMQKIIEVRFGSDNLLREEEKLSYVRYLNRILCGLQEDIISNKGHVTVNSKKELCAISHL